MKPVEWTARYPLADAKRATETRGLVPASAALQGLLDDAPADQFTLAWLLGHLRKRSFGLVMLLLALVAMLPGITYVAGLLLAILALELIAGSVSPVFPRRIALRPLPTRHLAWVVRQAIPVLRYLEKAIHPRLHAPSEVTKGVVGVAVLLLTVLLLLTPVPMFQVVPALVIVLISLAYLEEDGILLFIALLIAFALLAIMSLAAWKVVAGAIWIGRSWL
jgi:hypothetical protein